MRLKDLGEARENLVLIGKDYLESKDIRIIAWQPQMSTNYLEKIITFLFKNNFLVSQVRVTVYMLDGNDIILT